MTWAILRLALRWAISVLGEVALEWSVRQLLQASEQHAPSLPPESAEPYIWEDDSLCPPSE